MDKHSLMIDGHATSISLEGPFWDALKTLAKEEDVSLSALVTRIDRERGDRQDHNLCSALRVYVLQQLQNKLLPPA